MKAAALFFVFLAGGIFSAAMAQVPQGTQLQRTSLASYRDTPDGKKLLDFVITGTSATNLNTRNVVDEFEMKSFRDGDPKQIQIIAQAPECQIDLSNKVESDAGPLQVFTPATNQSTNLFVQGVGFYFAQSNHFLVISNQVETRVAKSLLKSSKLAVPRTNAVAEAGRILIFAHEGRFNFDSNVVDYAGNVHMIDPQLDMTCDLLTIHFTTNNTVKTILARHNVVLTTTNNGRATGETGFYYVTNEVDATNEVEMMQLTTNAKWRKGDEAADAQDFLYDSTRHLLTAIDHVRVQWPNAEPNPSGRATNSAATPANTNGFRELFADFAALQFPPTNGPVQSMHAHGHVIIVNQADQSSAMADRAEYERTTDRVELTGNPVWWNTNMEVKAETLTAELAARTYHAQTDAHFKMLVGGATNRPGASPGRSTNQWLFISSDNMDYQTNRAVFSRNVETRLVESNRLRDTLNCDLLTLNLTSNQVENAFARGKVRGETAPDASGVIKTISCEMLNAYRDIKTQLMKSVDAHTDVVIVEKGTNISAPRNQVAADTVTAQFSTVTNRIEKAVAEQNVVLDQFKPGGNTHATAARAVYTVGPVDEIKLTGTPKAHTDAYVISDADFMILQPKSNSFRAFGAYKIVPINKPAAGQKSL